MTQTASIKKLNGSFLIILLNYIIILNTFSFSLFRSFIAALLGVRAHRWKKVRVSIASRGWQRVYLLHGQALDAVVFGSIF